MYRKLAFRNMKRQLQNYLIYFVTVAMTISLIFAINNMIYSEALQSRAQAISSLSTGLLVLSIFLCLVVAIVLGYANSFMLKLRKREFGTYLTIGMKRHQIVKLFLLENSLLGMAATIVGSVFGTIIYQLLMIYMSKLMEYEFEFSLFSSKGILVTIVMVVLIFILSFITSSIYLSRVTIYDLIHGENKVNKVQRKPIFSSILTIISAGAIIYAFINFSSLLELIFADNSDAAFQLIVMIAILAVAIITFHIGLANCLMYVLLQNKKLKNKQTNSFVLRQLSASLSSNSLLLGSLAFLITFAIISVNTGYVFKTIEEADLEKRYPFDIMGNQDSLYDFPISIDEATETIKKYADIETMFETTFYTNNKIDFHKEMSWFKEEYTDTDVYVKQSDINVLLTYLGEEEINLNNQFAVLSNQPTTVADPFENQIIHYNGIDYTFSHFSKKLPVFIWAYFVIVVPDELVEGMDFFSTAYLIDLEEKEYDGEALYEELSYTQQYNNYTYKTSDYRVKEEARITGLSLTAIFIVGALYLGFVFLLLSMAILALKTLSSISDDEKNYRILDRLGVNKNAQSTTLAKQIAIFFVFPIAIPLILIIPTSVVTEKLVTLSGNSGIMHIPTLSTIIVVIVATIFSIYYVISFKIAKKYIIKN